MFNPEIADGSAIILTRSKKHTISSNYPVPVRFCYVLVHIHVHVYTVPWCSKEFGHPCVINSAKKATNYLLFMNHLWPAVGLPPII